VTTQAGLIAAINSANSAGGSQVIALGANITLLESTPNNTQDGPNGLPSISSGDDLTIFGDGYTIQRNPGSGNASFRLFDVAAGASLTLTETSLENGLVSGTATTTLQGGAIFVEGGGNLYLDWDTLSGNAVNYTGGGSSAVILEGGAIYNAGTASLFGTSVIGNAATLSVTNAAGQGNSQGDNDSTSNNGNNNGNGLIGNVTIEGAGIYNSGSLAVAFGSISGNSVATIVTNGSNSPPNNLGNGNSNGVGDSGQSNGNGNGNGIFGNVTVEGGGIYNAGPTSLGFTQIVANAASSTVTNGSHNGDNNSQNGTGASNGDGNGNGVLGNVIVAGGGTYNFSQVAAAGVVVAGNHALSTVSNGSNNGDNNGVKTDSMDGNDNGNGVDGNITVVAGGVANDANGIAMFAAYSNLSANGVANSIINGSNNGNGDGFSNTGTIEGKSNGNGVNGQLDVGGGAINIASGGTVTVNFGTVSMNVVQSSITNGNSNGNGDGNNDGDGDGLASPQLVTTELGVRGGAIRNAGTLVVFTSFLNSNSVTSTVTNGSSDGSNNGNNDTQSQEGRADGNGVSGNVLVAGGAIASSGTLTVSFSNLALNLLSSAVANGSNNGDNNGQNDGSNNSCGINCGDGIDGNIEVDGGAIGTSGTAAVASCTISTNSAASTVTNGTGNGTSDGTGSTGADGQANGSGTNGNVEVVGGGLANFGTLSLSSQVFGDSISSSPSSGSGNPALNGVLVNGTVTLSGQDIFG
jgi:hypothetical protein